MKIFFLLMKPGFRAIVKTAGDYIDVIYKDSRALVNFLIQFNTVIDKTY